MIKIMKNPQTCHRIQYSVKVSNTLSNIVSKTTVSKNTILESIRKAMGALT